RRKYAQESSTPLDRSRLGSQKLLRRPRSVPLRALGSVAPTDHRRRLLSWITSRHRQRAAFRCSSHFAPPLPLFRELREKPRTTDVGHAAAAPVTFVHRGGTSIDPCASPHRPKPVAPKLPRSICDPMMGARRPPRALCERRLYRLAQRSLPRSAPRRGGPLRENLLVAAEALAHRDLVSPSRVAEIRRGQGHHDTANDLIALAALFRESWATIHGRTPSPEPSSNAPASSARSSTPPSEPKKSARKAAVPRKRSGT